MTSASTPAYSAEAPPHRRTIWVATYFLFLLLTAELITFCLHFTAAATSREFTRYFGEIQMPVLTNVIHRYRIILLLLPLPWAAFAIVTWMRGSVNTRRLLGFSTTLLVAVASACVISAIGCGQIWLKPTGLAQARILQPTELADALRDAEQNNAAANYLLFRHYVLTGDDPALAERHLERAANLGSELARQTLRRRSESVTGATP